MFIQNRWTPWRGLELHSPWMAEGRFRNHCSKWSIKGKKSLKSLKCSSYVFCSASQLWWCLSTSSSPLEMFKLSIDDNDFPSKHRTYYGLLGVFLYNRFVKIYFTRDVGTMFFSHNCDFLSYNSTFFPHHFHFLFLNFDFLLQHLQTIMWAKQPDKLESASSVGGGVKVSAAWHSRQQ